MKGGGGRRREMIFCPWLGRWDLLRHGCKGTCWCGGTAVVAYFAERRKGKRREGGRGRGMVDRAFNVWVV